MIGIVADLRRIPRQVSFMRVQMEDEAQKLLSFRVICAVLHQEILQIFPSVHIPV